jgi:16S rRNA processing protein RimM
MASGSTSGAAAHIELGLVGAPFGVRGWVKLHSYTDPPERLLVHRRLQLKLGGEWKTFAIEADGRSGGQLTAKLAGIGDRNAAEALRGVSIGIERSGLEPPRKGEFYRADLIGLDVVNVSGVRLGAVAHFIETPAHALMVVRGETEIWVPAVPQHLKRVDLRARRVVIDWEDPAD